MENTTEEIVEEQFSEIEQKRLDNIEIAHATNKLIINHKNYDKNKKFSHFDIDTKFKANQLNKELDHYGEKKRYWTYKRGQVVSVNFGTNIGSEISGEHFAIVLTKNDQPASGIVTVIPLTSKYNENYIPLGKEVWNLLLSQIIQLTDKYVENYNNLFSPIIKKLLDNKTMENESNNNISTNSLDPSNAKDLLNIFSNLSFSESFLSKYQETKNSFDNCFTENDINNILNNSIPQEYNISKDWEETLKLVVLLFKDDNYELLNNMFQYTNEIYNIIKSYVDKDKDSYAIINQITTISKYKIRKPISDNDPIKRIKISKSMLDIINAEIIKQFANNFTK